jgi:hypothetical protein
MLSSGLRTRVTVLNYVTKRSYVVPNVIHDVVSNRRRKSQNTCFSSKFCSLRFTVYSRTITAEQTTTDTTTTAMEMKLEVDPHLVHRILLTDPSDFKSLTRAAAIPTLTFAEFREKLLVHHESDPGYVVKRAYHDHIMLQMLESIEQQTNKENHLKPFHQLLLDLHASIRALVPNRKDLHSILQDDRVLLLSSDDDGTSSPLDIMLPWIIQAAQALAQLESEARVETTRAWIQQAEEKTTTASDDETSPYSFLICSLFYLIDKTEVCAQEKQDFYLSQVVAPRLYTTGEGYSIERRALHERFGVNPPTTRDWIRSLVTEENKESLRRNPKERRDLIHRGWIDSILFQKQKQTVIPEIFLLDMHTLQSIRCMPARQPSAIQTFY